MLNIVLIRPGSTDFDRQGRIQGTLDIPLNDAGREEIQQAIEPLRAQNMQIIYAAAGEAAEQSAQILAAGLDLKYKVLDDLQNLNQGLWQGLLIDDVKTKQPRIYRQWQDHPETICPPGGEMIDAARNRAKQVLTKLSKKYKTGTIGLVVPEPLASLVRCLLRDDVPCDFWKQTPCATWEILPATPGVSVPGV